MDRYDWNETIKDAPEMISKVNTSLKKYSEENNLTFIDYYSSLVNNNKGMKSSYANDGVHPTREGYDVMAIVLKNTLSGVK